MSRLSYDPPIQFGGQTVREPAIEQPPRLCDTCASVLSFLQDQFDNLQEIGAGGMGKVYLATHKKLHRPVALKVLLQSGDAYQRRRFLQEAQAASALNHPNIIVIYDVLSSEGADVIVMEYVAGKTLVDLIPKGGFRLQQTVKYGLQIADALAAAHSAGIVHRDLKPGNIMVTERGHVKILDFGLAKLSSIHDVQDGETAALAPLTVQGSIVGTLSYMSPEQAQGMSVDARSDIFALGSVLYEMVTGERAFSGDNSISILSSVLRDEPKSIRNLTIGIPDELDLVIARCLRKNPADRWQSMEEVRQALEQLREPSATSEANRTPAMTAAISPAPQSVILPEPPKRSRLPLVALSALLVAALGALGWWLTRSDPQPEKATVSEPATPQATDPRPSAFGGQPAILTNERVLEMVQAKLSETLILSQIRNSPGNYDLSSQEVIRLVRAGVPEKVIEAMRNPTAVPAEVPAESAVATTPAVSTVRLSDGLPIAMVLAEDVPLDPPPQTPLAFTVAQDVAVDGVVVIPEGALAKGTVTGKKRRLLIMGSRVVFDLSEVAAVNDSIVKIRATPRPPSGDDDSTQSLERNGAAAKSKNIAASKGTRVIAYVSGDQQISPAK